MLATMHLHGASSFENPEKERGIKDSMLESLFVLKDDYNR